MYYVYILKSRKDQQLYFDYTEDLKRRLIEHNSGLVKSTKHRAPFNLVYYEVYAAKSDAKFRESNLKRFSGSTIHLKKRIRNSLMLFK